MIERVPLITRPQAGTPLGLVSVDTTLVGNVGAGQDTLMSYTLPANRLDATGRSVRITAWGTATNNANAKTLRVQWGTAELISLAITTGSTRNWYAHALVTRTAANTQAAIAYIIDGGGTGTSATDIEASLPTETDTAGIVIKCTGEAVADNDLKQYLMLIEVF